MVVRKRVNEKDAYARLRPIYDFIENEISSGEAFSGFTLSGVGVLDAYYGGFEQKFNVAHLVFLKYPWTLNVLKYSLKDFQDPKNPDNYIFKGKNGDFTVSFKAEFVPIWSCEKILFTRSGGENFVSNDRISLLSKPTTADEAKEFLAKGIKYCQRYGWAIEPHSLEILAKKIEFDQPFEVKEAVLGFRAYSIENGYLKGGAGNLWITAKLSVDCPDFHQHINDSVSTVGGYSTSSDGAKIHACGIYIYKDPTECVHYYGIGKKMNAIAAVVGWGDIWEGERGYRVEHSRIEKLWVMGDNVQLRPYDIVGGVIVNAKLADFYREIYTSGLSIDSANSLF